jgi:uncharacterized cupredoxin-like copper-binding protein
MMNITISSINPKERTSMKRIFLFVFIASIMVLTTACGGSTPAATQAPAQPAATQAPAEPAPTEGASSPSSPAELAPVGNTTQVQVTLADNSIESSLAAFQVGTPYTFVIKNAGRHAHNFNINTPVAVVGSLENALSTALLAVDQAQLSPGATATVDYTFPDSAAGAQLEFSCLIRRHYEDGMFLPVTVTK